MCRGEFCDDNTVMAWRDSGSSVDLLSQDDASIPLLADGGSVAELFYVPGEEPLVDEGDLAALDSLSTLLVRIETDVSGVPVEIDGRIVGSAPTVAEVSPGWHTVVLHNDGATTSFRLEARADPESWCFEARGRSFKDVRCL